MATLCNTNNTYTDDSSGSKNDTDGGVPVTPSKSAVSFLKCISYLTYNKDTPDTLIEEENFPDTLGTTNPYSKCTNNQIGTCQDKDTNTGSNVERWTVIQSSCSGHTEGRPGTSVSISSDIIDYKDFEELYNAVNAECTARGISFSHNQPNTYNGKIVDDKNPFKALNDYLEKCKSTKSGKNHINNNGFNTINPSEGYIIKHSDVSAITTNLKNITQDCICYSDCNGYSVCYCYGNCQYY